MIETASQLSQRELDALCSQYEKQLHGPMRQQQLAINCARDYFSSIPESERTPEQSGLEELFSDVAGNALREELLDDLEIMKNGFESPELQNEFWFDFQHIIYVQACRLELYYPLAQKAAAQYGLELPGDIDAIT
jgi:hypothetical protein